MAGTLLFPAHLWLLPEPPSELQEGLRQQGKVVAIIGQPATNTYVKHMEIRTNSRDGKANIERGPALRLNKQREMRSWLK